MNEPRYYHDPVFSIAETAEISGISEHNFRKYLTAGQHTIGLKKNGRIIFSAHECFVATIAGAIVSFGFPPAFAMQCAMDLTGRDSSCSPDFGQVAHVSAYAPPKEVSIKTSTDLGKPTKPIIFLPLSEMWDKCMAACQAIYATEAA